MSAPATCTNCHAVLHGRWCHACGQDSDARTDSLRAFLRENLSDLAHLDSRGLRTLRDLLFGPGRLTAAYFQGHRVRYLSAVQLYLIAAALFFLVNSLSPFLEVDGATWSVRGSLGVMEIGEVIEEPEPYIARGVTPELFEERLQSTANAQLPGFLIAVVVAFGLFVALMYPRRERNLLRHLVFALHWTAFYLLLAMLERALGRAPVVTELASGVLAVVGLTWLTIALLRVYGQSWKVALAKAVVLFFAFHALLAGWIAGVLVLATRAV